MPFKSLSSVDIAAIVEELQLLIKGKIAQVYQKEEEFLLQLHLPGKGKQLLKIIPGKLLCITRRKETADRPTGLAMQLRKYLTNAFIAALYQKDAERVVVFELEKQQKYYLIIELFSKGNLVLTDGEYTIIAVQEQQRWKDRLIKPGKRYIFPTAGVNWKKISPQELFLMVKQSAKRNLATALATDFGLGGLYAEELCRQSKVSKGTVPREISVEQAGKLYGTLQQWLERVKHPEGYAYDDCLAPFPLESRAAENITATFSEAVDLLRPFRKVSPYEKKIEQLQRTLVSQEEALRQFETAIQENTRKGELIYEHYLRVRELLGQKKGRKIIVEL